CAPISGERLWGLVRRYPVFVTNKIQGLRLFLPDMDDSTHQAVIQERIRYYFNQLTIGCGDAACTNQNCASSANFAHPGIDSNRAAALALRLLRDSEPMCFSQSASSTDPAQPQKASISKINHVTSSEVRTSQSRDAAVSSDDNQCSSQSTPTAISPPSNQTQEIMEGEEVEEDNRHELLEESTPNSAHNDISPGLSRFLLQVSNSPPPSAMQTPFLESAAAAAAESGDDAEATRLNHLLGLLDRFVKQSNRKGDDEANDAPSSTCIIGKRVEGLKLTEVQSCVADCEAQGNWTPIRLLIEEVFTSLTALANSFTRESKSEDVEMKLSPSTGASTSLKTYESPKPTRKFGLDTPPFQPFLNDDSYPALPVDIEEARATYKLLLERLPKTLEMESTLSHLLRRQLIVTLRRIFRIYPFPSSSGTSRDAYLALLEETNPTVGGEADRIQQRMVNLFATIYACPLVTDPLHFEPILPHLCHLTASLPMATQARLCRTWAEYARAQRAASPSTPCWLLDLHRILMQQITLRCLTLEPAANELDEAPAPNDDHVICDVARVIRVVFYASLLAGGCDSPEQLEREANEMEGTTKGPSISSTSFRSERTPLRKDPLGTILGISPNDCRNPLIPPSEFLNETLNEVLVVEKDFANFRSHRSGWPGKLSFMELPFMLQTTTKSTQLYYDNRLNMLQERRGAILHALFATSTSDAALEMPYFKICVARERVVEDALVALELTRMEAVGDLKKQLYVEFDGEQGIDEGGLSKEFFQLIIERIFNPDYGMFVFDEESQCYWFNRSPLAEELDREYCLIGTILGLAIYNNIILDIHFPAVLFRKLCGKLASSLADLEDAWPDLAHGLQALLDYEGDNFEEDHCLNFVISYSDMFGQVVTQELVPDGASKPVTIANRQEFVDRTVDFLLNTSVRKQFSAFRKGFLSVVEDTPLFSLFSPSEVELLLRGSQEYDFGELERVTEYEGDYNTETPVIRQFWSIVHAMSEQEQRKLLQFTTGTDRIPVGGMSRLKFVIARQGPDSDRLPTAHTCFNVLLLPEYSNKEKLERCLRIAITYSKGFGMF
uniref:HECT-type E3 ubiquitin transferase n=1 Tax=Mesocestoides corti TaxID=53468 RepID=A0A5K3ELT9_MESCO